MHIFYMFYATINAVHLHCEVADMSSFKIPKTPSTTNKTIRFPNDLIEAVEKSIRGKESTFSAFVIAAVRAALEDLEHNK